MHSKYIKNSSFWELKCGSDPSRVWRGIIQTRDEVKNQFQLIIGDGKSTFFWFDPWLPCGRLIDLFGERAAQDMGLGKGIKVNNFISNNSWCFPCFSTHELIAICDIISQSASPTSEFSNEVIWKGAVDGKFSIKTDFRGQEEQVAMLDWCDHVSFKG